MLCDTTLEILLPAKPPPIGKFMLPLLLCLTFRFSTESTLPWEFFSSFGYKIPLFIALCAADKKMCFSPGKVSLRMIAFDCSCTSGVGDAEAEY